MLTIASWKLNQISQTGAYGSSLSSSSPGSGGSATSGLLGSGSSLPLQVRTKIIWISFKFLFQFGACCNLEIVSLSYFLSVTGAQPGPWACLQLLASPSVVACKVDFSTTGSSSRQYSWKSGLLRPVVASKLEFSTTGSSRRKYNWTSGLLPPVVAFLLDIRTTGSSSRPLQ